MKKILFLLLLLIPTIGAAQGLGSDGKDFYLGWLYPSYNNQSLNLDTRDPLPFFGVYILVSSYTNNTFTISYFDSKGKEINFQKYTVNKRRSTMLPIDRSLMRMTEPGEIAEWKSIHVTAKNPINVQFFSSGANSGGSYLASTTSALGKEYVVESYSDNPNGTGGILSHEASAGYFMVVAPFDGTSIKIIPNSTTAKGHQGVNCGTGANGSRQSFTVNLQRGQCYMVKSEAMDSTCDISGSTVTANKPIAVIAGHENALTRGSNVGETQAEQRDYMVEEMLPVELWDSTGYYSCPFVDSKSAPGGDGDNLAFFYGKLQNAPASYPSGTTVHLNAGDLRFEINQFPDRPAEKIGVVSATSSYTITGVNFHEVQYDQRMQGGAPYPAPSQLSLMPQSAWRTTYLWYVPSNLTPQEVYQGYYITLICNREDYNTDNILVAQDGGPLTSIRTALPNAPGYPIATIPGHPELMGVPKKLNAPRTYFTKSLNNQPFVIYNYGFRAIDADRDLGDFCSDDHFFGYANPVGFSVRTKDTAAFTITVDTLCASWSVCVSVDGIVKPKLRVLSILNDPEGIIVKNQPNTGYNSTNVRFSPQDNPDGNGEINLPGLDAAACFKVYVDHPLDSAYGAILIGDDHGHTKVIELRYKSGKAGMLADTITSSQFSVQYANWTLLGTNVGYHRDSLLFPYTPKGSTNCAVVKYYVAGREEQGSTPVVISKISSGNSGVFSVQSTPSNFPVTLRPASNSHPADTLFVNTCFSPVDTLLHLDTIVISTTCFDAPVLVFGPGGRGLITATDVNFGTVLVNTKSCAGSIIIRNLGNFPFTLTPQWAIDNITGKEFSMDAASAARLPYILYPKDDPNHPRGDTIRLTVCYAPTNEGFDSTTLHWTTDISAGDDQIKSWSYLKGKGILPGIESITWDKLSDIAISVKNLPVTRTDTLENNTKVSTQVLRVFISGADSSEFSITANQKNLKPLENFALNPDVYMWVNYTFTPDITKPLAVRFIDRHAQLIATYVSGSKTDSTVLDITGILDTNGIGAVAISEKSADKLIAYSTDEGLMLKLTQANEHYSFSLYDLLGREIKSWKKQEVITREGGYLLPIKDLSSGAYILRMESATTHQSCTIVKD